MSPIPALTTRTAHRDPGDRIEMTHPYIAAALILAGHQLLQVIPGRGHALYIFSLDAQPAVDRLKLAVDEVLAHLERATQEQERRTRARS
jgi:hypothetical protein